MKKIAFIFVALILLQNLSIAQTKAVPATKTVPATKIVPATKTKHTIKTNAPLITQQMPKVELKTFLDTVSYCIGLSIYQSIKGQKLNDINLHIVAEALKSTQDDRLIADSLVQNYMVRFQQMMVSKSQEDAAKSADEEKIKAKQFLQQNAQEPGVITTPSGLQYKIIKRTDTPNGLHPNAESVVTCHYHGTLLDGTVFDSSKDRGQPASFPLNGVIKGWQEGIPLMQAGDIFKFWIPSDLGYGDRGTGPIKPGSTLVFEVELISFEAAPARGN
ncbi:MAG: FKBP-type peptidyl-prolyl cis-trans isomerase [Alphaproteobacteria bacterium]|nr:FKBP-type peptidyl-prolyl cis-trans isomerase [Alphaproteobacteria bacterium]